MAQGTSLPCEEEFGACVESGLPAGAASLYESGTNTRKVNTFGHFSFICTEVPERGLKFSRFRRSQLFDLGSSHLFCAHFSRICATFILSPPSNRHRHDPRCLPVAAKVAPSPHRGVTVALRQDRQYRFNGRSPSMHEKMRSLLPGIYNSPPRESHNRRIPAALHLFARHSRTWRIWIGESEPPVTLRRPSAQFSLPNNRRCGTVSDRGR